MQSRSRSTSKQTVPVARKNSAATSAVDSLRAHDKMASLMPAVMRMTAIQQDCAANLSGLFENCSVLRFDSGQLVLSAPNAAIVARLKQKLPNLQDALSKSGWQVSAIQLKVQPAKSVEKSTRLMKPELPKLAIDALSTLEHSLEKSPRNEALIAALGAMVQRHR